MDEVDRVRNWQSREGMGLNVSSLHTIPILVLPLEREGTLRLTSTTLANLHLYYGAGTHNLAIRYFFPNVNASSINAFCWAK